MFPRAPSSKASSAGAGKKPVLSLAPVARDSMNKEGISQVEAVKLVLAYLEQTNPIMAEHLSIGIDGQILVAEVSKAKSSNFLDAFEVITIEDSDSESEDDAVGIENDDDSAGEVKKTKPEM